MPQHRLSSKVLIISGGNNILSHLFSLTVEFKWNYSPTKVKMTAYKYLALICALLAITITLANGQLAEKFQNPCGTKITCHDCIQTETCAWCMDPEIGDKPRCFQPSIATCREQFTWNPSNKAEMLIDRELTRGGRISTGQSGSMSQGGTYEASSSHNSYSRNSSESESYEGYSRKGGNSGSHRTSSGQFSYGSYSESGRIVQIAPQRVALELRISKFCSGHLKTN